MKKILGGLLIGFFVPVAAAPALAGFQEGADAYKKADYATAFNEWLPLAQGGNAEAENAVGALYDNGLGLTTDEVEAFRWYSMAAEQNFPMAMRNLGTMYATGRGTAYDLSQAQLWLGRAAGAGDQVAAKRLAALPPVATGPANPVAAPLFPGTGDTSTTAASTTSKGFGTTTGPSSLFAPPVPSAAPALTLTTPSNTAPITTTPAATTPTATTSAPTFPVATAAPATVVPGNNQMIVPAAKRGDEPIAPTATPVQPVTTTTLAQPTSAPTTTQTASATPTAIATPVASTAPAPATPATTTASANAGEPAATGSVADGWHAFDTGDYKTALSIWQPIAQNGDSNLQVLVGSLYDYGQGVAQDKATALKWYLMAAQKGSGRGQLAAGSLLAKDAKQRNLVESYKWLTIASQTLKGQGGDVAAGQALSLREQIAPEMSKDDIAKAESLAQSFHAG